MASFSPGRVPRPRLIGRNAYGAYDRHVWIRKLPGVGVARRLTLGEYRELLAGGHPPSREQIEDFARFVSTAHSWYKWPLLPPGVPMTFFLYPSGGAQRITVGPEGQLHQVNSLEGGFIHSSSPTDDRFGNAAYDSRGDTLFLIPADGSRSKPVFRPGPVRFKPGRDELVALPHEVLEAGVADVTAVMHPRASLPILWRRVLDSDVERVEWPAESGGAAGLEQILERARALIANPKLIERPPDPAPHHSLTGCDFALYRLLSPERERQQRGILAALERVVDLVA